MKTLITALLLITIWHYCFAPPVTTKSDKEEEKPQDDIINLIHYGRYLKEVVAVLESDPGFKKKLDEANEDDIKSGNIAHELDFVSHHVRTQLDELKRIELDRLREYKEQLSQQELDNNVIIGDPLHGHLDHSNKHTFEIPDLKNLIAKTTQDLRDADLKRKEEFKHYEMQKEFEKQNKLNHTNGSAEREKLEKEYKEMEEKHKKHEPLHEPGHKAQLEEVWEEQDHMQQKFDPVAFFMMHDLDSNGYWDEQEVKALFIKELDKLYQAGAPEDDVRERAEEMERMRETVFKEMDRDGDDFISRKEFIDQTRRNEFEQDHGWKGIDEQGHPYSEEEMQEYIRQQQKLHPPPAYGQYPPPHPNEIPQGYAQPPPQYYQGQPPPQYGQHPQQQGQYQQPPQYNQPPQHNQPPQYNQPPQHNQPPQYNQPPQLQGQYQQVQQPPQYQQPVQAQSAYQPPPPAGHYQQPPQQPPVQSQQPPVQAQQPLASSKPSPQVNPPLNNNQI